MKILNDSCVGFTLIETLIVIVIMGIITTIIPLSSSLINNTRLESVIDRIISDLRWARMEAIITNKTYFFRIYSNENIYLKNFNGRSDYIIYYKDRDKKQVIVRHGEFPGEYILFKNKTPVKITDDYYERIKFYGYGTAMTGTIGLENSDNKMVKIVVSQRGRMRIEK